MRETPPVEDLGDGVWSLPVPIPDSPLGYTLVYALESPHGPVLVDTGWNSDESWRALTAGLEHIGLAVTDVCGAVLTHFHPDHSGLAGRLRETSGAWIAMHHADAEMVRRLGSLGAAGWRDSESDLLRRAGAPAADIEAHIATGPRMEPPAPPDRELFHGELLDLPDRKLRVLWTPGHSPGHICLHLEESGHLFTGDHVLPRITPHVGLHVLDDPALNPLGHFLDSLTQISQIGATEALPAHERRFTDPGARTTEIIAHHEERLELLADALSTEPATLWELTPALTWRKEWRDMPMFARRMAVAETAAHLRLLERRGLATCLPARDAGTALRWTSTADPTPAR